MKKHPKFAGVFCWVVTNDVMISSLFDCLTTIDRLFRNLISLLAMQAETLYI